MNAEPRPTPREIDARLCAIEEQLRRLAAHEAEVHSGFANSLRAEDWEKPPEIELNAAYRDSLLEEQGRLRRMREQ